MEKFSFRYGFTGLSALIKKNSSQLGRCMIAHNCDLFYEAGV